MKSRAAAVKRWTGDGTPVGLPKTVQQAASLLDQQIWCWGRDIECSGGNLLVRHGFQRVENPTGRNASSLYRLDLSETARVILRGFGVFYGDDHQGGVFLRRFDFAPQLTPQPDLPRPAWSLQDLPPLASPRADQVPSCRWLLLTLIDWIRQYEVWIAERVGVAYRAETLLECNAKHGTVVAAEEVPSAWRMLGVAVSDHSDRFIPSLGSRTRRHA